MGELIVFIVVFYVIGKILKAIFGGFSKSDYHLDYRIRICMFFMFLSFYRRLSDCLVRAEGTP